MVILETLNNHKGKKGFVFLKELHCYFISNPRYQIGIDIGSHTDEVLVLEKLYQNSTSVKN